MAMSMTIAIQQAFRSLLVTCFFIGLGVYPVKEQQSNIGWILHLSSLYTLTIWFIYGCLWYNMVSFLSVDVFFRIAIVMIVMASNVITTIVSVILNIYYNKRFMVCMKRLAAVDDTLEKLGTPKTYQKIYMWSKRIVTGWIVYTFGLNFYETLWWLDNNKTVSYWAYIIPHIQNYCYHVGAYVDLIFIFFMWYIGTRFDKVNEHMQHLVLKEEHMLNNRWTKSIVNVHRHTLSTNNYKQTLWSSMHLHLELCHIARELNLMFGMQMTLAMTSYLIFLTAICYYLYEMVLKINPERLSIYTWFRMFFWTVIYISYMYITNYICENISIKANKIDKIIHQLTNSLRYTDVWKEIYQFTLQAMHRPLKFTGMGLFYFGNEFLRKFCLTIIMFLVLILQMKKV